MSELERQRQAEHDTAKMLNHNTKSKTLPAMPRIASDIIPDQILYREYQVDPLPTPTPVMYQNGLMPRRAFLAAAGAMVAGLVTGVLIYKSKEASASQTEKETGGQLEIESVEWPYSALPWPDEKRIDVVAIRNAAPQGQFCIYGPTPQEYKPEVVERILQSFSSTLFPSGSPALVEGGQIWIDIPKYYRIDARFPLAFFVHESSAGTNPNWDGITMAPPEQKLNTSRDMGNISCTPNWVGKCFGRWRAYDTWAEGIEDWCKLMWAYARGEVGGGGALTTIEQIIPVYAPSSENNVPGYISAVDSLVTKFQ